ncbi:MAG: ABC transporter permease [Dorea sp.]|nr:ABC transporter permease [Dorea sp.]MCI9248089.1 ABC transporter permease [Dorea sp.]
MKAMLKIFKSSISDCILCFLSAVLVSGMLFLFEGVRVMILASLDEYEKMHSNIGIAAQTYIFVLLFIGVILIMYTVGNYSRTRLRDYGMFLVLGAEKLRVMGMIISEYAVICGISSVIGCGAGFPFLLLVRHVFKKQGIPAHFTPEMFMGTVCMAFLYMFLVFAGAVLLNLINIRNHSLSSLMDSKEKKSRIPSLTWSAAGVPAGVSCVALAAFILTRQPVSYEKMKYAFLLFLCGTCLLFTHLGNLALRFMKKREKWYYRHLLRVKNLYYRFSDSRNLMLAVFLINFFVLVFVNMNIVEYKNTTSKYLWKYPYDYVWMTEKEQIETIRKASSEWENEMKICPYTKVFSNDGGEYIGISLSSYRQLSRRKAELEPGMFLSIIEKAKSDEDVMFPDEQVYLMEDGKARQFWRKAEWNEILFVAQQPELIGIIVMEDGEFDALRKSQGTDAVIVVQNVEGNNREKGKKLNKAALSAGASVYSKESLMRKDRQEDMTTLIFYICLGIFLIISDMTALAVKVWSEIPQLSIKYGFLKKMGMDDADVRANIKGELSVYMQVPFWLSIAAGGAVAAYILQGAEKIIIAEVLALFVFLAAVQAIYIAGVKEYGYRAVNARFVRRDRKWN